MGYMHIENLYRPQAQDILLFKECYALEKIHGTSAHVKWLNGQVSFSAGGASHEAFVALFDAAALKAAFEALGHATVVVYGEAYGGKMQGMSQTYGKVLKFIVFDVSIDGNWLDVPNALDVAAKLGMEFVHYLKVPTDIASLDQERDAPSVQANRNGMDGDHIREGIVLRPLIELTKNNGSRMIAKHKRAEFNERATIPEVDPSKRELMANADAIALEWVTDMRLTHVLDKLGNPSDLQDIPRVIAAMVEDVTREASGEIVDNKAVRKAIGGRAVKLYKARVTKIPETVTT